MHAYRALLSNLTIEPLEKLREEKKREYWEMAKRDAKGRLNTDHLKIVCKCLYTIDYFISNNLEWPNQ